MKPANYAPVYCSLYPALAEITREHGYALAIHGTLGRDMDLICIPWTEKPSAPFDVVTAICKEFALRPAMTDGGPCAKKLHGRMAYAIVFAGGGFIDLSFMPVVPTEKKE